MFNELDTRGSGADDDGAVDALRVAASSCAQGAGEHKCEQAGPELPEL